MDATRAETLTVGVLTYLSLTLPLRGSTAHGRLAAFILVATLVGTICGRRWQTTGARFERLLWRGAVAAVVAALVVGFLTRSGL